MDERKKYYSTSNVSLCNETCKYLDIDFTTKRFICECNITSNFSDNNTNNEKKEEEDISYDIYFLSFINYKINICYKIFLQFRNFIYNFGFYIAVVTIISYFLNMIIFLKYGVLDLNKKIMENIPSKGKLKEHIKEKKKKKEKNKIILSNNIKDKKNNNMNKNKKFLKKEKKSYSKKKNLKNLRKTRTNENLLNYNKEKLEHSSKIGKYNIKNNKKINIQKKYSSINLTSNYKKNKIKEIKNYNDKQLIDYKIDKPSLTSNPNNLLQNNILYSLRFTNDNEVDENDFNTIPFTQALRIDKRNFFKMFISVLAHEISIINIFYYKNPFRHLSIALSIYIFELTLDLALNCLLYTDDVVSKKFHNNGSIEYITSLSLSFISNVFSSLISSILDKLANYDEVLENIIKNSVTKRSYYLYIVKFKKYLFIKLVLFFFVEIIINIYLCYYMIIFCFVYQKAQGNIMINYIIGISESIAISLFLAIIISLIRYISIIKNLKSFYYTSKYLFENF